MRIILILLVFAGTYPAYAEYVSPTPQEQSLFDELRLKFDQLQISRHDVSGILESFDREIAISFPCGPNSANSDVSAKISTRLAKFDSTLAHKEGAITGGIYSWKCAITYSAGHLEIKCDNELMLNSDAITSSAEKDQRIREAESLVILYHELLHGQLMLDAMESSESWRDDACQKKPQEKLDYSYTDADHQIINPLQAAFAEKLITKEGGTMKIETISPAETDSGSFSKKVGSLYDYPEHVKSGINISARSYNISTLQISSQKTDIIVSGALNNKTQDGTIWFYVFGKEQDAPEEPAITEAPVAEAPKLSVPSWVKNNAKWWAAGTIQDRDFVTGIQYLIQSGIITIPPTSQGASGQGEVPYWVKSNAKWWAEDLTSDSEFVAAIQYLIRNGIMKVETDRASIQDVSEMKSGYAENDGASPVQKQVFVSVKPEQVEKAPYGTVQIQIAGKVEDYKSGTSVLVQITRPGGESFELQGIVTNRGLFTIPVMVDSGYETGTYSVAARYNGYEIGTSSFTVK